MKAKSAKLGRSTSGVEVTNVSPQGFWLLVQGQERFIAFEHFPWFQEASIRALCNVQLPSEHHLYWPDLDVDLAVDSLEHPERFPLVSSQGKAGAA
jgi:hypothetical protein